MQLNLTEEGKSLLLQSMEGAFGIRFKSVVIGNGDGRSKGSNIKELDNQINELELTAYTRNEINITITSGLSNAQVSTAFRMTELGVLVVDPNNSAKSILFAYCYTPEDEAILIPAAGDYILETTFNLSVYVGDAENISAVINESLAYPTKKQFDDHVNDRTNPHGVTKAQVGLGSVPNVTTNNQTPTYTVASSLANLASGEKLGTAMGKLARAVSELISHLNNKNNPHKVTASQAGAAAASHKHAATDITSGILGVSRGGTGVSSSAGIANLVRSNLTSVYSTRTVTLKRTNGTVIATGSAYLWAVGPIRHVRIAIDTTGMTYSAGERMQLVGLGDYLKNGVHYCLFIPVQGAIRPEYITGWVDTAGEMSLSFPQAAGKSIGWIVSETCSVV